MEASNKTSSLLIPGKKGFCYGTFSKGNSIKIGCKYGDMIVFILSGRVRIMADICKEYYFKQNTFFILKQDDYKFEALSEVNLLRVCLSDEWVVFYNKLKNLKGQKKVKFLYQLPWMVTLPRIDSFLLNIKQKLSHQELTHQEQDELQVNLISLLSKNYSRGELYKFLVALDRDVTDFYKFILDSYKNMGLEEIITASGLSVSTFNRKFNKLFGVSPYQWIIAKRAEEIHRCLKHTKLPVAEIMKKYKFTDYAHFNRFCKLNLGATPTVIRKGTAKAWG